MLVEHYLIKCKITNFFRITKSNINDQHCVTRMLLLKAGVLVMLFGCKLVSWRGADKTKRQQRRFAVAVFFVFFCLSTVASLRP